MDPLVQTEDSIFFDSFTGFGDIVNRSAELGGLWGPYSYGTVTGGRLVQPALYEYIAADRPTPGAAPGFPGGWQLDVDFYIPAGTNFAAVQYQQLCHVYVEVGSSYVCRCALWYYHPEMFALNGFVIEIHDWGGIFPEGFPFEHPIPLVLTPGLIHRVTVKFDPVAGFEMFINETLCVATSMSPSDILTLTGGYQGGFAIESYTGDGLGMAAPPTPIQLDAVRLNQLTYTPPPPPPPSGDFWTRHVGTREL